LVQLTRHLPQRARDSIDSGNSTFNHPETWQTIEIVLPPQELEQQRENSAPNDKGSTQQQEVVVQQGKHNPQMNKLAQQQANLVMVGKT
jgi:hypothetical protein